jgi:hypothetical protein
VTLDEHVLFRALALGLPNREVLSRDSKEHVSRDSKEYVSFRASALGLPHREILNVTLRSTFR